MPKSPDAFRTISEVAEDLDLPQHVLRFWETRFPQIKPLKRGGGRRYYRPEDVVLLRRIRQCLYQDGYTIKGVQRLLREGALKHMPLVEPVPEIGEPVVQSRVEACRQGEQCFVAIKPNDIAHAIADGLAMGALRKMLLHRELQGGIEVSLKII